MSIRYWSGLIIMYRETLDHRMIPEDHRILFPLRVPVLCQGLGHDIVGQAHSFLENRSAPFGVRGSIEYDNDLLPEPFQQAKLYPAVQLADVEVDRPIYTNFYTYNSGILRSITLTEQPVWADMVPVTKGERL